MYAKIFQSIYDGSIAQDWQVRLVFMDFLILADPKGVVDMTPDAIARRTGVPLEIIQEGIAQLEAPDPNSRRPDMDGKRIERLDNHRSWGWRIVNYQHYRNLCSIEQKREIDRQRLAKKRKEEREKKQVKSHTVGGCRVSSLPVADVAQEEEEGEEEAYTKKTPPLYFPPLGQFKNVRLTDLQLNNLKRRFGDASTAERIEALSEYLASKGKKYKNHYATILSWDRMAKDKHKLPEGWA